MKLFALLLLCMQALLADVVVLSTETPVEKLYKKIHQTDDKTIVVLKEVTPAVLQKIEQTYQDPKVWMTLPDAECGISFYAGLFKQIKLEDLYEKLDLAPLIAMAGNHAVKIAGHHSVALPESRSTYLPVKEIVPKKPDAKADLVIFSFDRPLQLYAFLESTEKYIVGLGETYVIYRTSNGNYEAGYEKVRDRFNHVKFLHQGADPKSDFQPLFLQAAFKSPSPYILFAVDDVVVKGEVDLAVCIDQLEKTQAYGFYLRLGKHIDYCYMADAPQTMPPSWEISEGIYAWQFDQGEKDWKYPCSVDMSLYKKSAIEKKLKKLTYHNPNLLESVWALKGRHHHIGLCFAESKVVNLPLNMVNQSNIWFNRHVSSYSPLELLEKFEEGLKIDIAPLHHIVNQSPHIDFDVSFIPFEEGKK